MVAHGRIGTGCVRELPLCWPRAVRIRLLIARIGHASIGLWRWPAVLLSPLRQTTHCEWGGGGGGGGGARHPIKAAAHHLTHLPTRVPVNTRRQGVVLRLGAGRPGRANSASTGDRDTPFGASSVRTYTGKCHRRRRLTSHSASRARLLRSLLRRDAALFTLAGSRTKLSYSTAALGVQVSTGEAYVAGAVKKEGYRRVVSSRTSLRAAGLTTTDRGGRRDLPVLNGTTREPRKSPWRPASTR